MKKLSSSALKENGIENIHDYRKKGNWFGNASLDGMSLFNAVTFDFDDLVKKIEIKNQYEDDLKEESVRTVSSQQYGRCYEITFSNKNQSSLHSVELKFDISLRLFFDMPFHFHTNSRSSKIINAKVGKRMILPVAYEILRINHDTNCRQYSDSLPYCRVLTDD